jgi:hypothetical protein
MQMFGTAKKPPDAFAQIRVAIAEAVAAGYDRRRVAELLTEAADALLVFDAIGRPSPLTR